MDSAISEVDKGWLAGLLEGEGCFLFDTWKGYNRARIQLSMTDRDIVDKAHKLLGCGQIVTPKPRKEGYKQQYRLNIRGPKAIEIMLALKPLMGQRRSSKIDEVVSITRGKKLV